MTDETPRNWTSEDVRTLTDVLPALVSFFDDAHICRFANNYHRHWYGRTPEELVGRHMRDFLGEEGYQLRRPYLERVAGGETVEFDANVPHLDGTPRAASIRYVPRTGTDGFEGFYILVFDTELHQHRFRSVFDGSALAFWELDVAEAEALITTQGSVRDALGAARLIDFNQKAGALFLLDRSRDVGGDISRLWPPESEPVFEEALAAFRRGDPNFEAETILNRADGSGVPVLCTGAFRPGSDARRTMALGLVDLSDRIAREQALAQLQSELAHAARIAMLGELTASIAHEVNQPLGAVVNNGNAALRWLQRPKPELEEVRQSLTRVVDEARRAADIIARTRALATKGPMERGLVDPGALVRETATLVSQQLHALGVKLRVQVNEPLAMLHADRVQLQQVLVNLLVNAGQAMAGQPERAVATMSVARIGGAVVFSVEDTGPGIAPAQASQLFNAFFTTKATGMGIGLSISKTIVEAHGGEITAGSSSTGGAEFTVTLPTSDVGGDDGRHPQG